MLNKLLLLIVFCQLGNKVWRVDPSAMDITQISQAPTLGKETLVIHTHQACNMACITDAKLSLSVSGRVWTLCSRRVGNDTA